MNMQHMTSSKKGFLLIVLLVSSTGTVKPINSFGKAILGGIGIIGGAALVRSAWNGDYDRAERCVDGAHECVREGRDFYGGMLQRYQLLDWRQHAINPKQFEQAYIPYIERLHASHGLRDSYSLQDKYPMIWFVNRVKIDMSDCSARVAELSNLADKMRGNRSYYSCLYDQCLAEQRKLTEMSDSLGYIEAVASLSKIYRTQKEAYQLEYEQQKIREFENKLAEVQRKVEKTYRRFVREYDALYGIDPLSYQFEAFLGTLIPVKHTQLYCGVNVRYNFAALWYLSDLEDAITQLKRTKSSLRNAYDNIKKLNSYHGSFNNEYNAQVRKTDDLIDVLSRIKNRLPSLAIYTADQHRYDCELREREARERESRARERECNAWARERNARDRERRADERARQARVREREAAARSREERAYERESRAREREARACGRSYEVVVRDCPSAVCAPERVVVCQPKNNVHERERQARVRERSAKARARKARAQARKRNS